MFNKLKSGALMVALTMFANLAWGVTLKHVSFSSLPGDRTAVTLSFDGTPPKPTGYTIQNPARIAIDLKGVSDGLQSRYHNLGVGNAQSLTVIATKDRTRLIFDLVKLVPYTSKVEGDKLRVVIGSAQESTKAAVAASQAAKRMEPQNQNSGNQAAAANGPSITDVNFHRGANGAGRVVVTFSTPKVDVDVSEKGGSIDLLASGVKLPDRLRRRLDVTDFATPVQQVDAYPQGQNSLIKIKPTGTFNYLAYQTGNKFTVSVEKLSKQEQEKQQKSKFPYTGKKLSLNFQNIDVRSVLQLIADFTGLNLVASDSVKGNITLRLQNVPWDQALDLILKTKGLAKRQVGNVLLVAPAAEIAAREKQEAQANKQIAELAPVHLDIIQVNYAKAKDIVHLLKQDKDLISDRGFISYDPRTNTISVRETDQKLEQIRKLVSTWDVPVRQVLIEARIVRARTNVASAFGVQWGGGAVVQNNSNSVLVGGSQDAINTGIDINNALAKQQYQIANNTYNGPTSPGTYNFPQALAVDLGVSQANTSHFAIGLASSKYLLSLELDALQSEGKAEVVAQPKVVTADRQKALIQSGTEIPYQEASSSGATSTSFKKAVLSLQVTPQITPDDKIIMDLDVHQDTPGAALSANGPPPIDTNQVQTQVLVSNGQTIVLGGIFESTQSTTITKTPFLGDIPYLGRLFTKKDKSNERSELLVFITPKIVKNDLVQ